MLIIVAECVSDVTVFGWIIWFHFIYAKAEETMVTLKCVFSM